MRPSNVEEWWLAKSRSGYQIQSKHLAVAACIGPEHFPLVDLGAGNGLFLRYLEDRFPHGRYLGVDQSVQAVRARECRSEIVLGDILDWRPTDLAPKSATLIDVIEHVYRPEELLRAVREYAPVVFVACPNFSFLTARLDVLLGRIPFQNKPARGGHIHWCEYFGLKRMFADCGWSVTAENHLFPRQANVLARRIGRLRPSLFAHEFVFVLSRRADGPVNSLAWER